MKKKIQYFLIIITIIVSLILLTGCNNENEEDLNKKVIAEIEYFNSKLITLLNRLNNITFENYEMTAEKVELSKDYAGKEKTSSSEGSQNSEDENSSDNSDSSKDESKIIISSEMSPNTILNPQKKQIDWSGIKNEIENLYFAWNTVILDLHKLNVNSNDILAFSSSLDTATNYIKNEDKENSLIALASLYSYLPKYMETISDDTVKKDILQTKSYILNSYALSGQNDWEKVKIEITKADETFRLVATNVEFTNENSYKVNKSYVLLNELKNSISIEDRDIFFIKYRNLLEEINEL